MRDSPSHLAALDASSLKEGAVWLVGGALSQRLLRTERSPEEPEGFHGQTAAFFPIRERNHNIFPFTPYTRRKNCGILLPYEANCASCSTIMR